MEIFSIKVAQRDTTKTALFQLRFTADEVIEQFNLHYNLVFDDAPAHTSTLIVRSGENLQNDVIQGRATAGASIDGLTQRVGYACGTDCRICQPGELSSVPFARLARDPGSIDQRLSILERPIEPFR